MTRIIAGVAGGRRLQTPKGEQTRPTSDRVREALFSAVEAWAGSLHDLRFLDLYAGSGAIGLEAWSRGVAAVTLVEADRRTADLVRANARSVGCDVAEVVARSVASVLAEPARSPYDIVFADPPYPLADDAVAADLAALVAHGWLADGALVVVERSRRSPEPAWPDGLEPLPGKRRLKKYGETHLWLAEAAGESVDTATDSLAP
ncbi:16S rRNA (guanine966-N2)-methyltransferase [Nocardioides sp. J9]|uniref:16S rRNA (guanine(966)-N(2))-methyltransferase RsmD n=1 Tax=unclassified Nocardioides TaxID=2615069 RepID=UPI0004B8EC08|nr:MULTISPECIES: 16S rRNA (guanine(966)-N(2))-methyltransferase RsmD [unclassified Nocardioides]TWG98359.1 16S rRNA (guanine966-N2)-methyltransferase [Nocardioides sp. J9]